jgi:tetratricopeptide (TPR) repeat protein
VIIRSLNKPFIHFLLIFVTTLLAYSNTFNSSFHYDDNATIIQNPIIKNLEYFTEPSKARIFQGHFEYPNLNRRYIGYLTFALNYKFHGLDVTGYHIVNFLIHIVSAFIIYLLIRLSFKTPILSTSDIKDYSEYIALTSALLFACHPIQTQAVTYITQRVASLTTMFYLLAVFLYVKWRIKTSGVRSTKTKILNIRSLLLYLMAVISTVLAMKTKETAFTLPIMISLYELIFFEGKVNKRIVYLIPFLLTMLIIPLSLVSIDKPVGELIGDIDLATRDYMEISRKDYFLTQFSVLVTYIRLIFLPIKQNLEYDYPVYSTLFELRVLLSSLILFTLLLLAVYLLKKCKDGTSHNRLISFGIFWFFITLSVESSLIPIPSVIYEHRMYLASFGVFLALTTAVFVVREKFSKRWRNTDKLIAGLIVITIISLTGATYARNSVWKDDISLWRDVVRKSPSKARAHSNLCDGYQSRGLTDEAITECLLAVSLNPYLINAHYNLGTAYMSKGLMDEAIKYLRQAIMLKPTFASAYNNLGIAYNSKGLTDEAIKNYQLAIRLNPIFPEAYNNIGFAYQSKGLYKEAIKHYRIALKLKPDYIRARENLNYSYRHMQQPD